MRNQLQSGYIPCQMKGHKDFAHYFQCVNTIKLIRIFFIGLHVFVGTHNNSLSIVTPTQLGHYIHSKLRNITPMATRVHMILQSFVVLIWMHDAIELVQHVVLWNLKSFSSHLHWCHPLHLAFLDDVSYACTNIQQVA